MQLVTTARLCHSRRARNQIGPSVGRILVRAGSTQRAGRRRPQTATSARAQKMLPVRISGRHIVSSGSRYLSRTGCSSHTSAPAAQPLISAAKTGQGRCVSGQMAWANAGE